MVKSLELTPKQEAFAQKYTECLNASLAYRTAYDVSPDTKPESVWQNASRTLADQKIANRVMQLQREAAERNAITLDEIIAGVRRAIVIAEETKNPAAMSKAAMDLAKLKGETVDRIEVTGKDGGAIEHEHSLASSFADALRALEEA